MEQVASMIVSRMLKVGLISVKETAEYVYEIQVLLEKLISYAVIFGLALILNRLMEIALFTLSFSMIRKYSGGLHCLSFKSCLLVSIVVSFSGIIVFPFVNVIYSTYQGGAVASVIVILVIGSINNSNIDWNEIEYRRVKQVSRLIVILEAEVLMLLVVLETSNRIRFFISYGIVVSAMSMLLEIRKKGGLSHEECRETAVEAC